MSYDLHTHSTYSDGSYTPLELILYAAQKGLEGLSITDHDTVDAYPEALTLGQEYHLQILPGVEFSCHYKGQSVHILGYSFDYTHPSLLELCRRHKERRKNRNLEILEKLKKIGFVITEEELINSAKGAVGRPHIAKLLVEKGYVVDIPHAFKQYIGDGKRCYAHGITFTIEETLHVIHEAKGLAVLAHPHLHHSPYFVKELLKFPFDGLEAEYSQMPLEKNALWINLAKENHLLTTGGSDFHCSIKPTIDLGDTMVKREQIEPLFTQFYSHYKK